MQGGPGCGLLLLFKGLVDSLSSVLNMKLFIYPVDVLTDGACRNAQLFGDFLVQKSLGKQMKGFIFTN
jgi:hypothetical protein